MSIKCKIGGKLITLPDSQYLGAGGQAAVYRHGKDVVKIYHDPAQLPPASKLSEIQALTDSHLVTPRELVYNATDGTLAGFSMREVTGCEPICKWFTQSFKQAHGITQSNVLETAAILQKAMVQTHIEKVLFVDFNELNILVSTVDKVTPAIIDLDSVQTPHHHATAIMESIRDPQIQHNKWTELSDWYSWAIIVFNALVNIHPFKGTHPAYKVKDWPLRKERSASVFDQGVRLPPSCPALSSVPTRLLGWFQDEFQKGNRSTPPPVDSRAPVPIVSAPPVIRPTTGNYDVQRVFSADDVIQNVFVNAGRAYYIVAGKVFTDRNQLLFDVGKVISILWNENEPIYVNTAGAALRQDRSVVTMIAGDVMTANGCAYSLHGTHFQEHTPLMMGAKSWLGEQVLENVHPLTSRLFDGIVYQNLLGKAYFSAPYKAGSCAIFAVPLLDGHRILDAKCQNLRAFIHSEKSGKHYCTTILLKKDGTVDHALQWDLQDYEPVNFAVRADGLAVKTEGDQIKVFAGVKQMIYDQSPIDSTMRLFQIDGQFRFVDGNEAFTIKLK